jgi:hypothetical protein
MNVDNEGDAYIGGVFDDTGFSDLYGIQWGSSCEPGGLKRRRKLY